MKVLVSVVNLEEAKICQQCGVDIIDVKNPAEGSLGANYPWVIRDVKRLGCTVSAAIGDACGKPGSVSLAAFGAASAGADYVKVGVKAARMEICRDIMMGVRGATDMLGKKAVAGAYADYGRANCIHPVSILEMAHEMGYDAFIVDTAEKDGRKIFEFMDDELHELRDRCRDYGIEFAIAGSIEANDYERVREINPDIVGVRGGVCSGGREGKLRKELIDIFVEKYRGRARSSAWKSTWLLTRWSGVQIPASPGER